MITHHNFYNGKSILITGHTGFKGAWLTRVLTHFGAKVSGIALPPEPNSLMSRNSNFGLFENTYIDIRNENDVDQYFASHHFDGIFHMAAQPLVLRSYKEPVETFNTNVMGTAHILNATLKHKSCDWVLAITTDKVYKNVEKLEGYKESDPLGGKDPYSASKAASELVISTWESLSKLKSGPAIVAARAGNVIGGGDHAEDRLLPDLVRSFKNKSKAVIRNPKSLRPWQHVLDPINGYLTLGNKISNSKISKAFNFGPKEDSKLVVQEVAEIACRIWTNNQGFEIKTEPTNLPESGLLWLDSTLARKELGWETKLSASDAIKLTLEFEMQATDENLVQIMDSQISSFFGGK